MLKIRLLGEMAVLRGGEPLAFPPSKKTRALLAYLVATGRPQRRERLCSMLWELPDDPRGALRWSLSKVRALVDEPDGASRVVADRETVAFVAEGTACDLHALREVAGRPLGSVPTALLQQVAADIGGEFLEGLDLPTQPDFQAWCLAERENARRQHAALLAELTLRLSSDAPEEAALHARRRVALEPYDEMAHVVLVDLLARAGRRQEAEQQCAAGVRLLGEAGIAADALTRAARALRIPPRRPPEAPLAAPMAPTEAAGAGAGGEGGPAGRLVIVDDEPEVGRMVAEYLTRHGFAVRAAMSGRELDALLAAEPADLLLLDVKMPGEDGFSIARRLQGRNGPPVLFLTAASDVIDRVVGLELGALDYITKPFDVRELRARVRNVLRRIDSERKASALAVNPDRPGAMTPAAGLIAAASARAESQATAAERKHVTLLVATVAEMKPEERRDVELSLRHLEPSLAAIGEILGRYGGAITTLQADSVTGAFGAPAAHEDDAASACFAALAMQETLRAHWPDLILRIGLHAGEIIVRPAVGAEHPTGIEAVGPAVRLAGRIAAIAASGIVLTGETVRRVNDIVTVVPLEPGAMPGLGAVRLYALTGRAAPRSRWDIRAARGLSPFCGRDIELETLRRALERVGAGHGEVVTIVGEPGMGKSRLVHEFLHALVPPSWGVLATATTFHDTHAAYRPIGNLLRSWLGVGERETQDEVAEKLAAHISGTRSTLAAHRPALLALLDLPVDDATWPALNPSQRRRATQDAIRAVLARESQLQPLVVLFEDLHWADAQTSNALDVLVETLGGLRLLLVVTHRPQHQHGWAGKSYVLQLRLDPFPAGTADALLQALLGPDTGLSALRRFLIARTEGVPLFLEEAVRALAENGALVGGPGNYRLATSVITLDLPPTVQAVLTARIDGLPPPAKTLLQTASVIGREVPWVLLRRIAGLPDQALQETLAALQSAEFLFEIHPPPDPVYVFKHALTQEAAYGGLLRDRRRTLHVELVHAIEECYRGRLDEQVDRLAEHALAGGLWDEAVRYVLQAANRAIARSAHRQAADLLERGLAALEHLPETAQRLRLELDYRKALGVTMMALRGWGSPEVSDAYTRARLLCERLGDERELFVALRGQGQFHMIRGELQTARALGQHCMAFAIRSNDNGVVIETHHLFWSTSFFMGDYADAERHAQSGMALYDRDRDHRLTYIYSGHDPGVCCRCFSGLILWQRGQPDQALARCQQALALAEQIGHPLTLALAAWALSYVHLFRREPRDAQAWAAREIAICEEYQLPLLLSQGTFQLGWALVEQGEPEAGIARMQQGLAGIRATGAEMGQPYLIALLGDAHGRSGRTGEGLAEIERAVEMAEWNGAQFQFSEILRLKGELLRRSAAPDEAAEACFRQAMTVAQRQGARLPELRATISLMGLQRDRGEPDTVRPILAAAYGRFAEGFGTSDLHEARRLLES